MGEKGALLVAKAKIPTTAKAVPRTRTRTSARTAPTSESSLFMMRLKELDREFARQTRQLTILTKKLAKKIARKTAGKTKKLDS
jgi:hypothetical protein